MVAVGVLFLEKIRVADDSFTITIEEPPEGLTKFSPEIVEEAEKLVNAISIDFLKEHPFFKRAQEYQNAQEAESLSMN